MVANCPPFNVTGHPALSINAGFSDGLPVGVMIVGRKFDEATVLNVAYAYEKIRDAKDWKRNILSGRTEAITLFKSHHHFSHRNYQIIILL